MTNIINTEYIKFILTVYIPEPEKPLPGKLQEAVDAIYAKHNKKYSSWRPLIDQGHEPEYEN